MKQTEQPELNRPIIQQRTTYLPARLPCSVAPAWRVGVTSRSANAKRGCETRTTSTGEVHIPLDPVAGPARSHPGLERRRRGSAGRRRHRMDKRVSGQPGGEGRRT